MGISIIAVAALLVHMLTNAAETRKPSNSERGRVPTRSMMARATRRWRFHRSIASESMKPPMNKKMMGSA